MAKTEVFSEKLPPVGGAYSQAVQVNGLLFTSGWGPHDPGTGSVADNVGDQTRQILRNLRALLEEHGAGMADVVKSTVHLQHLMRDFAEFNRAYAEMFTTPYPVRTTVGSDLNGILVEIDFIVALPVRGRSG